MEDEGMSRFWTCHWQFRYWRPDINAEGQPACSSGSNSFIRRGVSVGDTVYIVSLSGGQLYLGGRMVVKRIVSRPEAVRLWDNHNLYNAKEWVVDPGETGTPLHLHRCLSPALTKQLRFETKSGPQQLFFISDTELDNQTTRGIRELTSDSATLLDRIIAATDQLPRSDQILTVTHEMIQNSPLHGDFRLPDEVPSETLHHEGSIHRIEVNRYERDAQARLECIAAHGTSCCVCGFSFENVYGQEAGGYIHVHHIQPLSEIGDEYVVDPAKDLRPVCPNCHAVLHLGGHCRSIEEVRQMLRGRGAAGNKKGPARALGLGTGGA
jgi:hypothetical protein